MKVRSKKYRVPSAKIIALGKKIAQGYRKVNGKWVKVFPK